MTVFSTSSSARGAVTASKSTIPLRICRTLNDLTLCIPLDSQVLTGSYHNYFRIYDVNESGDKDAVLQADKSAFKAKKIGGPKGQGKGPNGTGKKEGLQTENIDFAKKIVSRSWRWPVLCMIADIASYSCMAAGILERTRLP